MFILEIYVLVYKIKYILVKTPLYLNFGYFSNLNNNISKLFIFLLSTLSILQHKILIFLLKFYILISSSIHFSHLK